MKRKNVGGKKSGNVLNQPHHLTPAKGLLPLVTKETKMPSTSKMTTKVKTKWRTVTTETMILMTRVMSVMYPVQSGIVE